MLHNENKIGIMIPMGFRVIFLFTLTSFVF